MSVRESILARFAWIDGHADVWRLFADAELLPRLAAALADPFRAAGVTHAAGIEARGFVLAPLVAIELRAGFVPIRKSGALLPGAKATQRAAPDYRGREHVLVLQTGALSAGDGVLLVDDWAERGAQALAARTLIEGTGARFLGLSLVVDELKPDTRLRLDPVEALLAASELPPSSGS